MGDTKRAWCVDTLNVDPEELRRRSLRAELLEHAKNLSNTLSDRIAALKSGSHGADTLSTQFERRMTAMDNAFSAGDFTAVTGPRAAFDVAAANARATLEALGALSQELLTAGTAQGIEAEQVEAAKGLRDALQKKFDEALAKVGADLSGIHKELSPGKVDLEIRTLTDDAREKFVVPAFAKPTDAGSFNDPYDKAKAALETFVTKAEAELKPERERAAAMKKAREALDKADKAANAASATVAPFQSLFDTLVSGLAGDRAKLLGATTEALGAIEKSATAEEKRATPIGEAGAAAARLGVEVERAAGAADATPAKTLREGWKGRMEAAVVALTAGTTAVAGLEGIGPDIEKTDALTKAMTDLRKRAKELATQPVAFEQGLKRKLSADSAATLKGIPALVKTVDADTAAIGTLGEQLSVLEVAFKKASEELAAFDARFKEVKRQGAALPSPRGMTTSPAQLVDSKLITVENSRGKTQAAGEKALAELEALMPDFGPAVSAVGAAQGILAENSDYKVLQSQISSLGQRALTSLQKFTNLKDALKLATEAQDLAAGYKAYRQELAPLAQQISTLSSAKDRTINTFVKKKAESAEKDAQAAKSTAAIATLKDLAKQMPAMVEYTSQSDAILQEATTARKGGPKALLTLLNDVPRPVQGLVKAEDYDGAMKILTALRDILPHAEKYKVAYAPIQGLIDGLKSLAVAQDKSVVEQDAEFASRLLAAETLEGTPERVAAAVKELESLHKDLLAAKTGRRDKLKSEIGAKLPGEVAKLSGMFADEDTLAAFNTLYKDLGGDDLAAILKQVGDKDSPQVGGTVARAVRELQNSMGVAKIRSLGAALGGVGKVGALCSPEGLATYPTGLQSEFSGNLGDLTSLAANGFGGDLKQMRAVTGGGGGGAKHAKQLSDAFVNRADLADMVTGLGGGPGGDDVEAGRKMARVADTHFKGDFEKLKDPFYDTLGADHDLMDYAVEFRGLSAKSPPELPAKHGFKSGDMQHVLERHSPKYFLLEGTNLDAVGQTQFDPSVTAEDIATYMSEAMAEAAKMRKGNASDGFHTERDQDFQKCLVPLYNRGIWVQVGYNDATGDVDQFFPLTEAKAEQVARQKGQLAAFQQAQNSVNWTANPLQLTPVSQVSMTEVLKALGK